MAYEKHMEIHSMMQEQHVKKSDILDIVETKIAESEIAKNIEDHLDGCSKQQLIELHNFIFDDSINLDDVEWSE